MTGFAQEKIMPINLTTVLKLAGTGNLDIVEINARYDLAHAQHLTAKEWLIPTISPGVLMSSYDGIIQDIEGNFLDVTKNGFWAGLQVTANWDVGTAIYMSQSARQNVETAGHAKVVEKAKVNLEAVRSYYDLGAAQSKLVALEEVAIKSEQIVAQIALQVQQGISYKSDLLLAKAELNHIKITISKVRSDIHQKSNNLVELLNIAVDVQLLVVDSLLVPVELVESSIISVEDAFNKRPELLVLNSGLQGMQTARKSQTSGLLLPTVDFGLNNGPFGPYFSPEGNSFSYYVGARWDIPLGVLFYGGTRKEYDARIRIQEIDIDKTRNQIRREIDDEAAHVGASKTRLELAQAAVRFASEALEQGIQRQQLGTAIPLEVLRAQEQVMEAHLDLIDAITLFNQSQYALYIALGNKL
jgi:outer membrane protein TolC